MRLDVDVDVEIAGLRAGRPRHPLPRDSELLPRVDACGESDDHLAALFDAAAALAHLARRGDRLPRPTTARAGGGEHDEAALGADLPRTPALYAGLRLCALACSATPALLTGGGPGVLHFLFGSGDR